MDYSFISIIKQVNALDSSSLTDEVKLRRSGELFYQGSLEILYQTQIILDSLRQSKINQKDTEVDDGVSIFLASLT